MSEYRFFASSLVPSALSPRAMAFRASGVLTAIIVGPALGGVI